MVNSGNFLRGDDAKWQDTGPGRQMQMLCYNDNLMMLRWSFDADAVGEPHSHPHTQAAYIESGVFDVTIDGRTERLGPGSSYVVAGGICTELCVSKREPWSTVSPRIEKTTCKPFPSFRLND